MTFRDITWLKKAQADLNKTTQFMENIIDNSAEGIGIVDRKGNVVKWNKARRLSTAIALKIAGEIGC